ncbi:helix-turn-helix domain-containing protein [Streptomyces phaeochromogenes]|uniref:helix-turn-helix domain-containing protein n=1 Tax=Streptomyces phaeochromogenes TaxID=1923 RepID=UPI003865B531|nr:helix-turn-helix domain-containing protein [Streptomyces phaeochromogenes]
MARPEAPVAFCRASLHALASWLRLQRAQSGLSLAQMAQRTTVSKATLSRAASGHGIPALSVVRIFAQVCGASEDEAERLWKQARYEEHSPLGEATQLIHLDYVSTYADLHAHLLEVYRRDGSRPYRDLEQQAGGNGHLARTTICRVLTRKTRPRRDFVVAFVRACGVTGSVTLQAWAHAWERAEAARRHTTAGSARQDGRSPEPTDEEARVSGSGLKVPELLLTPALARLMPSSAMPADRGAQRGVLCEGCGAGITTFSDVAVQMGSLLWCVACGHIARPLGRQPQLVLELGAKHTPRPHHTAQAVLALNCHSRSIRPADRSQPTSAGRQG